jgi:hypothetical protein
MSVNTTSNIDGFLAGLDTTAKPFQRFKIEDIEETKGAMQTIAELISVIDFLKAHEAPAEYSEAVETAMGDTRAWVCRISKKRFCGWSRTPVLTKSINHFSAYRGLLSGKSSQNDKPSTV